MRVTKYFNGEDFNDVQFSHYFLKLYDMLHSQEQEMNAQISYASCLKDMFECVTNLKFAKNGARISGPRRAKERSDMVEEMVRAGELINSRQAVNFRIKSSR